MARKDVTNGYISQDMTDANDNFIELYAEITAAREGETDLQAKINVIEASVSSAAGGTYLLVSAADQNNGYAYDKITSSYLKKTITSPGGNEKLNFDPYRFGVTTTSSAVDITLTSASTLTQQITMTAADKFVTMPDATGLLESEEWNFFNAGTIRYGIKDSTGVFIGSIAPQSFGRLKLIDNSTAAGSWEAICGTDLIMNTLKTVCNAEAITDLVTCKLTATTIMAIFEADSKGKSAVITLGATITVSSIHIFETGNFDKPFVTRNSDTVAMVTYTGVDSDGFIAALTYNGVDTIATTNKYEFKDAGTISWAKNQQITSALQFVCYYDDGGTAGVRGQVLAWSGSAFSETTAETQLVTGLNGYADVVLVSGSASAAKILLLERGGSTQSRHITWNGTTLSAGSAGTVPQVSSVQRSMILIDSSYALSLSFLTTTFEHILELWDVTAATPRLARAMSLPSEMPTGSTPGNNMLSLLGSGEVAVIRPIWGGLGQKVYKLKVAGAASWKDSVIRILSEVNIGSYGQYPCIAAVSSVGAVIAHLDYESSNYLTTQKVSFA